MIVLEALLVLTYLGRAKPIDESGFLQFDYSSYNQNVPFFSVDFKSRLREWNKTLINASTYCAKSNTDAINIEIIFPVFGTYEVDREDDFLTFESFHPVLVRKKSAHDLAEVAYLAVLELWPLLVLCFSCAALSGILIWLLDSRSNSEQFPVSFWRGIIDGMWWAVVTMTTVGYGDKVPKSLLARLFAAVWMIAGIMLLSMFTAQVSSRLTIQELESGNHLFGKRIGVPPGLYQSSYVDYKMAYSLLDEISNPVESVTTLTGKSLDSVVVFHCDDKEFNNTLQVLQFLPPCKVGAELIFDTDYYVVNDTDPVQCMKRRLSHNDRKRFPGNHGNRAKKSLSCKVLLEKNEQLKYQFQWVFFESPTQFLIYLGVAVGIIVVAVITGTIWDYSRNKKRNYHVRRADAVPHENTAEDHKPLKSTATRGLNVTSIEMS